MNQLEKAVKTHYAERKKVYRVSNTLSFLSREYKDNKLTDAELKKAIGKLYRELKK